MTQELSVRALALENFSQLCHDGESDYNVASQATRLPTNKAVTITIAAQFALKNGAALVEVVVVPVPVVVDTLVVVVVDPLGAGTSVMFTAFLSGSLCQVPCVRPLSGNQGLPRKLTHSGQLCPWPIQETRNPLNRGHQDSLQSFEP